MKTSLTISGLTQLFGHRLDGVIEVARMAEDAGIDQVVMPDHVVMGSRTDRYPFGTFPYGPEEPWLEPLTTLAAIAGATERIRLGTGILIAPLRAPVVLAKTAATLDVLSNGRLDLGVGVGWQREEFDAVGVPFADRAARMDDGLRLCMQLWTTKAPVAVDGTDVWCEPRPVQDSGVPLWFGGPADDRGAARIAELGVGWLPIHTTTSDELRAGIENIRAAFDRAGRDPASLQVRATVPKGAMAEYGAMGVTCASFGLGRSVETLGHVRHFLEALPTRVR